MIKINKLKGKMVELNINQDKLADSIGISRATLYRKFNKNGESLTIGEIRGISDALNLTEAEAVDIFLS